MHSLNPQLFSLYSLFTYTQTTPPFYISLVPPVITFRSPGFFLLRTHPCQELRTPGSGALVNVFFFLVSGHFSPKRVEQLRIFGLSPLVSYISSKAGSEKPP